MRKLICLLLLLPVACVQVSTPDNRELLNEVALLNKKIDSLSQHLQSEKSDTVILKSVPTEPVKEKKETKPATPSKEPAPKKIAIPAKDTLAKKEPTPKKITIPPNDTIFHYYVNKKISVKIHPWVNGERTIELFDLYGNKTFEAKEIRKSYSQSYSLRFHPNGAVSEIKESFNPGASMYMYSAHMTFSTTNDPLVRRESRMPPYGINEGMEKERPKFWDKKHFKWVQQEIVE